MVQDRLRANREIGRGAGSVFPQEGIGKLRYVMDIAGSSVLSGSAVSGDRLPALAAV